MLASAGNIGYITRQPYEKLSGLDGYKYLIDCDTVAAIDRFFMSECSRDMTQTDIDYALDLIEYENTGVGRADIVALDQILAMMVVDGMSCATIQGAISGCN